MVTPCLNRSKLDPLVIKARESRFNTSILKHVTTETFQKKQMPFICPISSANCGACSQAALLDMRQRFGS